jgi:hypothetical protein
MAWGGKSKTTSQAAKPDGRAGNGRYRDGGVKSVYLRLRAEGVSKDVAARQAGVTTRYAYSLEHVHRQTQSITNADSSCPRFAHDDRCVAALIAAGGYARLSERPTVGGHVACLPLLPFEGRRG